jgi:hypothetical protein
MPRSKEHTLKALQEFLDDLYSSAIVGVRDQIESYPDTGHLHRTNTKRQITRDHIVDRLRVALDGKDGIRIKDENQTTYFHIHNEYRMLVKKSNEDGAVKLTKSQTSFDFQANEDQFAFDSEVIPDATNLYLGYVPNEHEPRNPSIVLVCPSELGCYWMHELEPSAAFIAGEIGSTTAPDAGEEEELVRVPSVPKSKAE